MDEEVVGSNALRPAASSLRMARPAPACSRHEASPESAACSRRREFCHLTATPCLSLLKHLMNEGTGGCHQMAVSPRATGRQVQRGRGCRTRLGLHIRPAG